MKSVEETSLYRAVIGSWRAYECVRSRYLRSCPGKELLFNALLSDGLVYMALELLGTCNTDSLLEVLPGLTELAGSSPQYVSLARRLILTIPLNSLLPQIEPLLIENLNESDAKVGKNDPRVEDPYWLYRRYLELASILDIGLLGRIIDKAMQNPDPEVREAGEEFKDLLESGGYLKYRKSPFV